MQVFISWSGETSKRIATALGQWLPRVLQSVQVSISTELRDGRPWVPQLASALEGAGTGFLCLTPDNVENPWVLFEAGALGMGVRDRPLFVLLFGIKVQDVPEPIRLFQVSPFSKERMLAIMKELHRLSGSQASEKNLEEAFDLRWVQLSQNIPSTFEGCRLARRPFECEVLRGRASLYERIAKTLDEKKKGWAHDTTWGRDAPDRLSAKERDSLNRYLEAQRKAVERGIEYKEIFSFTAQRLERIAQAFDCSRQETSKGAGIYQARVLEGMPDLSLPDFMVLDSDEVIISHVDADQPADARIYLHIRCEEIAKLYHAWFEECWRQASPPASLEG